MGEGYIYKGEGQEISGGEKANVFEWRFSPIVFSKVAAIDSRRRTHAPSPSRSVHPHI